VLTKVLFAEVTVALQLNQGAGKKRAVYRFFLDFSLLLSLHQGKESREQLSNNIFFSVLFLLKEKVPKSSGTADNTTPPCTRIDLAFVLL
jgi:hypothetical protein